MRLPQLQLFLKALSSTIPLVYLIIGKLNNIMLSTTNILVSLKLDNIINSVVTIPVIYHFACLQHIYVSWLYKITCCNDNYLLPRLLDCLFSEASVCRSAWPRFKPRQSKDTFCFCTYTVNSDK